MFFSSTITLTHGVLCVSIKNANTCSHNKISINTCLCQGCLRKEKKWEPNGAHFLTPPGKTEISGLQQKCYKPIPYRKYGIDACSISRRIRKINIYQGVCYLKSILSLGQFRNEAGAYKNFEIVSDDPLSPISYAIQFDSMTVCLSASPYIAFNNSAGNFCVSHISGIKRKGKSDKKQSYILMCEDYTLSDSPVETKIFVNCF